MKRETGKQRNGETERNDGGTERNDGGTERTEGRGGKTGGPGDLGTEGVKLRYSWTTMIISRKSSHIVAADMVAPGGVKRNPG